MPRWNQDFVLFHLLMNSNEGSVASNNGETKVIQENYKIVSETLELPDGCRGRFWPKIRCIFVPQFLNSAESIQAKGVTICFCINCCQMIQRPTAFVFKPHFRSKKFAAPFGNVARSIEFNPISGKSLDESIWQQFFRKFEQINVDFLDMGGHSIASDQKKLSLFNFLQRFRPFGVLRVKILMDH